MRCDSYAFGNCTAGACALLPWLPEGLGDGGDWAADYRLQGGNVTMVPTVGAAVCYCRGDGYSEFGHCGVVEQVYSDTTFLVREMNFVAFDVYDNRVSTMQDVCGFLLPPGVAPGRGASSPGPESGGGVDDLRAAWQGLADWLNTGAPYWVNEINVASNLIGSL